MSKEQKQELTEFIQTVKQLNALQLTLMKNSADTLLALEKLKKEDEKELGEK